MPLLNIGILLTLLWFPVGSNTTDTNATTNWRTDQCKFQTLDGKNGWSQTEVVRTINCAVNHWPVPGGATAATSVASCESGLNPDAWNGQAAGVFQQLVTYWPGRYRELKPPWWGLDPSVFNARSNVVVSVKMAHYDGWSPWVCQP